MSTDRDDLREARRLINQPALVCRQTVAYFDGISIMDKRKVRSNLQEAVRNSDRFLSR
ncbi:MAG: hypothetical protein O3A51_11045 [Verrucomicrobia bacterium]|nr:hypothetical protein [Verrucomicrobiota bacterium]